VWAGLGWRARARARVHAGHACDCLLAPCQGLGRATDTPPLHAHTHTP
jgi:hypothetical protein